MKEKHALKPLLDIYTGNVMQEKSLKSGRAYILVASFDALKQSTGIYAHLITFSSRKYIILNKLSRFSIKTYVQGGQRTSSLFNISLSTRLSVLPLFILTRHQFRHISLAAEENNFFTVVQCSQGVLCNVQGRPKIISSSKLKINKNAI